MTKATDTADTTDVLIVGAGPTGLALGVDLARRGVRARIVERSAALFPGSRGKGFQPRTLEVFDDLGVIDAVLAAGGDAPVGMIWAGGERQGEHRMFDPPEPSEAAPYLGPWLLPQWRTQEILFARLQELGGSVEFNAGLADLAQDADEVRATLTDGRTVRARYAVAADGGRSTVRRLLGIAMTGETVDPNPLLVADVRVRESALDRDNWHMFPPAGEGAGFLSICPLPGIADFQAVAQFTDGSAPDVSDDGVRRAIAERSHLSADDVTEVRWASEFTARAAMAERFRAGRVFLAGDAAHVHSPAGGQGLNTSVQDAYNLGWKLGAVLRDGAPDALLDSYEEERMPVAAHVLGLSTRVHRGETRRGAATQQLGLGYRDSSLTVETRSGLSENALRAGDRAPDGRPGGTRLFDVFRGPHWTLLVLGERAAEFAGFAGFAGFAEFTEVAEAAESAGVAGVRGVAETTGTGGTRAMAEAAGAGRIGKIAGTGVARASAEVGASPGGGALVRVHRAPACEAYGEGVFLVRPDGYVGWAGAAAHDVPAYLTRLGVVTAPAAA